VIGVLDSPYYWWNAGAMFDTLIKYWHPTGDDQYDYITSQALLAQRGEDNDYLPANQTKSIGNDDQSAWALAALSAAESGLPEDGTSRIALFENMFNEQVLRWDPSACDDALRWQIFSFQNGYSYKNSASNGHLFQLTSRLARYTGNSSYSD
jgi:mannan endo-1,6-alpha-mannosidase